MFWPKSTGDAQWLVVQPYKESAVVHGGIHCILGLKDCYCMYSDWHTNQETLSLVQGCRQVGAWGGGGGA